MQDEGVCYSIDGFEHIGFAEPSTSFGKVLPELMGSGVFNRIVEPVSAGFISMVTASQDQSSVTINDQNDAITRSLAFWLPVGFNLVTCCFLTTPLPRDVLLCDLERASANQRTASSMSPSGPRETLIRNCFRLRNRFYHFPTPPSIFFQSQQTLPRLSQMVLERTAWPSGVPSRLHV